MKKKKINELEKDWRGGLGEEGSVELTLSLLQHCGNVLPASWPG